MWVLTVPSPRKQRLGDLDVGQVSGDQAKHLQLAVGELAELLGRRLPRGRSTDELLDQSPGDHGGEESVPCGDDVSGGDELFRGDALEQETARPRPHRVVAAVSTTGATESTSGAAVSANVSMVGSETGATVSTTVAGTSPTGAVRTFVGASAAWSGSGPAGSVDASTGRAGAGSAGAACGPVGSSAAGGSGAQAARTRRG
jgi:hypothetical protein